MNVVEPFGVAFDARGNWYVCEHKGEHIVRIDPDGNASVFAGTGKTGYSGDGGPAAQATFFDPHGLVIARDEQLYVADTFNHCIRRIDLKTGKIASLAGTGEAVISAMVERPWRRSSRNLCDQYRQQRKCCIRPTSTIGVFAGSPEIRHRNHSCQKR